MVPKTNEAVYMSPPAPQARRRSPFAILNGARDVESPVKALKQDMGHLTKRSGSGVGPEWGEVGFPIFTPDTAQGPSKRTSSREYVPKLTLWAFSVQYSNIDNLDLQVLLHWAQGPCYISPIKGSFYLRFFRNNIPTII